MEVMKDLMSSCVGQLFWQGASAHLRHLLASFRAALSLRVVCLMSSKLRSLLAQDWRGWEGRGEGEGSGMGRESRRGRDGRGKKDVLFT
jgi:hypothetical protein